MSVQWLDADLRRIRAANPSAMTGTGTNTYLLGRGSVVLIDPGPASPDHHHAILAALGPQETLQAILVSHCHLDHSALAPALSRATGAPTYGFGPAGSGRSAVMQDLADQGLAGGGEGSDLNFRPDHRIGGGDHLRFGELSLQVLHTPGHTGCHLCFGHEGRLFSGDHVMGWSSSLISPPEGDMADYMDSLSKLAKGPWTIAHPGHGEAIPDPSARIGDLIAHRKGRETALLAALGTAARNLASLTAEIYVDTPAALWPAAQRNLLAHLIKLWTEGRIEAGQQNGLSLHLFARLPAELLFAPSTLFRAKL